VIIMRTRTFLTLPLLPCIAGASILSAGCGTPSSEQEQPGLSGQALLSSEGGSGIDMEALPQRFGYGRTATEAEIAVLDIVVGPDGAGLPAGQGTVAQGRVLFAAQCAVCHGAQGEGVRGLGDRLVGTEPIDSTGWNRTIGNYWPYATSVFDYVRRSMPFDRPGTLSDDEVYALTAYLLHRNEIIPADAVMDAAALPRVTMPARDRFVRDDRRVAGEAR
jgi:S-disulfanyl-L-cysteine oxidoreductase SoxD